MEIKYKETENGTLTPDTELPPSEKEVRAKVGRIEWMKMDFMKEHQIFLYEQYIECGEMIPFLEKVRGEVDQRLEEIINSQLMGNMTNNYLENLSMRQQAESMAWEIVIKEIIERLEG